MSDSDQFNAARVRDTFGNWADWSLEYNSLEDELSVWFHDAVEGPVRVRLRGAQLVQAIHDANE